MTINFNNVTTFMYGQNEVQSFVINNATVWTKPVSGPYVEVTLLANNPIYNIAANTSNIDKITINGVELPSNQWTSTSTDLTYQDYYRFDYDGSTTNMTIYITAEESGNCSVLFYDSDNDVYYEGTVELEGNTWSFASSGTSLNLGDYIDLSGGGECCVVEVVNDSRFTGPVLKLSANYDDSLENYLEVEGSCYTYAETTTVYTVNSNSIVKYFFNENSPLLPQRLFQVISLSSVSMAGITSIGSYSFYSSLLTSNTSIAIPDTVTTIGDTVFQNCTGLSSITLPSGLTAINSSIFKGCTGLSSITLPNTVSSIGSYAFSGCSSLTSISIPNTVSSIGSYAFSGCSSLTSINLAQVTILNEGVLSGCSSLTKLNLPSSLTEINLYALGGCSNLAFIYVYSSTLPKAKLYVQGGTTVIRDAFSNQPSSAAAAYINAAGGNVSGRKYVIFKKSCDISAAETNSNNTSPEYGSWFRLKTSRNTQLDLIYSSDGYSKKCWGYGWTFQKQLD